MVFHQGALGDSVLIWPLLRAIGPVALAASREKAKLAERWVGGVTAVDGDAPAFSRLFAAARSKSGAGDAREEIDPAVRGLLGGARRIISFISDGADAWAANVRALAPGAEAFFLRSRPDPDRPEPIHAFHARQLAERGWAVRPVWAKRRSNPDGPIVVHPGSGGRDKCWPADRFERVMGRLATTGRRAVLVLGEVERERLDAALLARWRRDLEVAEPADALELAELLAGAMGVVGNDSGPIHLAAQLGVPTLALFGPSDPTVWAPGPGSIVLAPSEPRPMDWLEVEDVELAVEELAARSA